MKDIDIDKAIDLRHNRDEARRHSIKILNYSLNAESLESYKFAFARLTQSELDQVKSILIAACTLSGNKL